MISYSVTFCRHAAKKEDFDMIVSFARLKSINPVIIHVDTISKQKFPKSRESPVHMEEGYQVIAKRFESEFVDERIYEVLSIL